MLLHMERQDTLWVAPYHDHRDGMDSHMVDRGCYAADSGRHVPGMLPRALSSNIASSLPRLKAFHMLYSISLSSPFSPLRACAWGSAVLYLQNNRVEVCPDAIVHTFFSVSSRSFAPLRRVFTVAL